jgi:hypothetical protein
MNTDERYLAPSYEDPVTPDDEREYAWHELPACDWCRGEGDVWVPPLGYGVDAEWVACPVCKGDGYVDPRSQT